jgi:hypothetical protein
VEAERFRVDDSLTISLATRDIARGRVGNGWATHDPRTAANRGPEFTIGPASGAVGGFGISFEASYGDTHQYEWAG